MTAADLERVLEINAANVPEVGPVDMVQLRYLVAESAFSLVVDNDGDVTGFCVVLGQESSYDSVNYRWFMERYDDVLYLDRVAFDASAQGRGLGSALYADIDRRLAALGVGLTLEVNVDPPNEPSLAFHRKHGYVEVGRQMSKGIEVSLMHKPSE